MSLMIIIYIYIYVYITKRGLKLCSNQPGFCNSLQAFSSTIIVKPSIALKLSSKLSMLVAPSRSRLGASSKANDVEDLFLFTFTVTHLSNGNTLRILRDSALLACRYNSTTTHHTPHHTPHIPHYIPKHLLQMLV